MKGLLCSLWAQIFSSNVEAKNVEQERNDLVAAEVCEGFGIEWSLQVNHHKNLLLLTAKLCELLT